MKGNGRDLSAAGSRDKDQTDAFRRQCVPFSRRELFRGRQLLHRRRCRSFRTWVGKERNDLALRAASRRLLMPCCGELPGGIHHNAARGPQAGNGPHVLTPEELSLLALVGGDQRIIDAYREAVIETLRWAEKNAAQTRMGSQAGYGKVATDNLTIGLFQHDTNRNQEPNLHFHAVVANVTQGTDGKWRALRNDKLWSFNTLLNSMTMARFRLAVEKMGYEAGPVGKHGNFEAAGIAREQVMAFSTRREEVLDAVRQLGENTPKPVTLLCSTRKARRPSGTGKALSMHGSR